MMIAMVAKTSRTPLPSAADDPRWARVLARDKTADGHFWYSVSTTGVYCRPSCPSRTANPRNVRLHATPADAKVLLAATRGAGFFRTDDGARSWTPARTKRSSPLAVTRLRWV